MKPKMAGVPKTAGLLRSAVAAMGGQADGLGDAGDEEAALVLDECCCRTRAILAARCGPPPTEREIAAAAVGLAAAAEALAAAGDAEAAGLFARTAERLGAILDGRTTPWYGPRGPRLMGYRTKSQIKPQKTAKNKAQSKI